MRIFIITMDEPVQTNDFIRYIIDKKKDSIVGLAVSEGSRMTIAKNRSKFIYLISLLMIMGLPAFVSNSWKSVVFKLKKKLSEYSLAGSPSILAYAEKQGISVFKIKTPNSISFREKLKSLRPDVIINQSQNIIKRELLEIPSIGIINRHNALLPKNRGRLTPFWVLYKEEKETGVSIHFVTEGIDAGDIIVQEKYKVGKKDNFNSLVKKNYEIAPKTMVKALELLEQGFDSFILNDDEKATYNTVPTLKEAFTYRKQRIKKVFGFHG